MNFTGYKELLREIIFQVDMPTLGSFLRSGKQVWETLRDDDMETLRNKFLEKIEYSSEDNQYRYHGFFYVRKDTGVKHGESVAYTRYNLVESYYRNGYLHGERRLYTGWNLYRLEHWRDGKAHGTTIYYDNGEVMMIEILKKGRLKVCRIYDGDTLIIETSYAKQAMMQRKWRDGILISEERFQGFMRHGWQFYYLRGKKRLYRKGKFRCAKKI